MTKRSTAKPHVWMQIAWSQVGVKETSGAIATPEILDYFREAGHAEVASDEVAWCAAFVGACLERAGITCSRSLMARSYAKFGTDCPAPRVGCIAVFERGHDASSGHVGFVVGFTDETIVLLGGNQANSVSVMHMPRERMIACRWPAPAATSAEVAASGSRIASTSRRQQIDAAGAAVAMTLPKVVEQPDLSSWAAWAGKTQGIMSTLIDFGVFAWAKLPYFAILAGLYFTVRLLMSSRLVTHWRTEDHNTGATLP
jgi:uncharacterized protein (TIGR02594 family)